MVIFTETLKNVAIMLVFIMIGYFFRRKNLLPKEAKAVLSTLLVYLFMPAYTFANTATEMTIEKLSGYLNDLLYGTGFALFSILICIPLAKLFERRDPFKRNTLKYAFAFSNTGYFGNPVIFAVFGTLYPGILTDYMVFCMPTSIAIYSFGYYVLTADTGVSIEDNAENAKPAKKRSKLGFLWSPAMVAMYLGFAVAMIPFDKSSIKFLTDACFTAGNCMSPAAMLLTGTVLAGARIKELFTSWKPYVIGAIRLIAIPLAVLGILLPIVGKSIILILAVTAAGMPIGMNVVVFPESCGKDSLYGAKTCFISYILALATIPALYIFVQSLITG